VSENSSQKAVLIPHNLSTERRYRRGFVEKILLHAAQKTSLECQKDSIFARSGHHCFSCTQHTRTYKVHKQPSTQEYISFVSDFCKKNVPTSKTP
jgi:hypothetical protein